MDIYGMVNEDFDVTVTEVLAECGRELPPRAVLRRFGPVKIDTVRDFALFIAACPEAKPIHPSG